jgi:hypothetical protein
MADTEREGLWKERIAQWLRYPDFFGHSCLVNFTNGRIYEAIENIHARASRRGR